MNAGKQRKRLEKVQKLMRQVDAAVVKARVRAAAQQPPLDPYVTYVTKAATGRNTPAARELDRLQEPGDAELREHAASVLKSSASGEARRLAHVTLDRLDAEAQARLTSEALRKQGRR